MRDMPTAARVAIATLYLRHRDARRLHATSRRQFGRDSVVTDKRRDEANAVWNDLQAVRANVSAAMDGHRQSIGARAFMDLVARRGRALQA